jgi:hypothetical protein
MLLAAILLLSSIPQNWDSARTLEFPVISSKSTRNSSLSQPLPSLPEPKLKTDAEAADGGAGWFACFDYPRRARTASQCATIVWPDAIRGYARL